MANFSEESGCEVADLVMPYGWKSTRRAHESVVDAKVLATSTSVRKVWGLPAVTQTKCVAKSAFMPSESVRFQRKYRKPMGGATVRHDF